MVSGASDTDEQALRQLIEDYGRGFDLRDEERFMSVWSNDAVWRPGPGVAVIGREDILAHVRSGWARITESTHLGWLTSLKIASDTATAASSGLVTLRYTAGEVTRRRVRNRDAFVLTATGWQIAERVVESGMKVTLNA